MESMEIKDINYYNRARNRYSRGKTLVSDVEIVSALEQEIEYYRKEIAHYTAADVNKKLETLTIKDELSRMADENKQLTEENKNLKEENAKLSEAKTFKVGDLIQFKNRKYKIRKVVFDTEDWVTTFIGDEVGDYDYE